jgi:hypothetical protein
MQLLHEHHADDAEAAIFYALALNGAVDFTLQNFYSPVPAQPVCRNLSGVRASVSLPKQADSDHQCPEGVTISGRIRERGL